MKTALLVWLLMASASSAFTLSLLRTNHPIPSTTTIATPPTICFRLEMTAKSEVAATTTTTARSDDVRQAIESAIEASKSFGASSPEARVAWDIVEEISAADNSVAFQPSAEQGCSTEEEVSQACLEYATKLEELKKSIQELTPTVRKVKSMADDMQAIKLQVQKSTPGSSSPELQASLQRAQEVSKSLGAASPEAAVAWAEVEEIAAAGLSNAMGTRLDEECLVESTMEACMALDELSRVINQQRTKEQGLNSF